ncbi:MAG: hypothetical protein CL913_07510 [Deltaproteobacteria bacterium]|nr:hypothetical protein [Deltaproteobacteria bacterium]
MIRSLQMAAGQPSTSSRFFWTQLPSRFSAELYWLLLGIRYFIKAVPIGFNLTCLFLAQKD